MAVPDILPPDCPAIHVTATTLADQSLFRWVQVGAEEEGVPCRLVHLPEPLDALALAYAAAESSRLNIGLALDRSEIILHETHMGSQQPVLRFRFDGQAPAVCRLLGGNAARMVVRLPFRFPEEEKELAARQQAASTDSAPGAVSTDPSNGFTSTVAEPVAAGAEALDTQAVAALVAAVVRKLAERGITS